MPIAELANLPEAGQCGQKTPRKPVDCRIGSFGDLRDDHSKAVLIGTTNRLTKQTHGPERDLFKACLLAVGYGMGAASLAGRIGKPTAYAVELLRLHRETYPKFWVWSDGAESHAMLLNRLHTVFGWTIRIESDANPRSIRNFPCQANGAEMLRLACCLALERGVSVIAPIHDAVW